jgi:hypothetical protein
MVPMEVLGVSLDGRYPVVVLKHEDRLLPIVVGMPEADAIHGALTERNLGRPMTHDLICNLLVGLRGELRSVTIYKIENHTFYAHLNIHQESVGNQVDQVLKVDSRPSDGIAIAVRLNAPIFASEEVMEAASEDESILRQPDEDDDSGPADDDEPEYQDPDYDDE